MAVTDTRVGAPGACRTTLASASCTMRYADRSTAAGSSATALRGHRQLDRQHPPVPSPPPAAAAGRAPAAGSSPGRLPLRSSLRSTASRRRISASDSRAVAAIEPNSSCASRGKPADPVRRAVGLHGDHRHVVGDDVVQLAGDPGALLQQRALGALGLADALLLGQPPLGVAPFAQGGARSPAPPPPRTKSRTQAPPSLPRARSGEERPGRACRQPHADQGAAALAQSQGQQHEIADDDRGVHGQVWPGSSGGASSTRAPTMSAVKIDPPGLQRPVRRSSSGTACATASAPATTPLMP